MENKCIANRNTLKRNSTVKAAQKNARKYYQEKLFAKDENASKAKIRKFVDLNDVELHELASISESKSQFNPGKVNPEAADLSKDELIALLKESDLTGRSGNGFEVFRKLEAFTTQGGTLIINGVECDPGLVTDSWIYRNHLNQVRDGALILKKALSLNEVILATKEPLHEISGLTQKKIIDRFPMGYEKYLIKNVLGLELAKDELPTNRGILVMNIQTVMAISELAKNTETAGYKYITVENLNTAKAFVLRVKIGQKLSEIREELFAKQELKENNLYIGSGAFMCHKASENEAISDTTAYIALGQMPDYDCAGKCKGCKACTKNCPAGVKIDKIVQISEKNGFKDISLFRDCNADACISCGACTYGCMAGKDIRELVACAQGK